MDTFVKRILGLAVGAAGLLVLSPVLLLVALLVRVNLGSPVLFRQKRIGYLGRTFELLKFRTMTDARDASGALLPDAARLTRFGRFLRAASLDELPQLWNVLKGDMTFVGPRPLLESYRSLYSPEQFHRHDVLPGVTGWAQVHGRNGISWDKRLEYDLWYVRNRSFLLDCRILAKTLRLVVSHDNVNRDGGTIILPPASPAAGGGAARGPGSDVPAVGRAAALHFLLRAAGDALLLFFALFAASELRFEFEFFRSAAQASAFFPLHVPVVLGVQLAALVLCGAGRGLWRFFGVADVGRLLAASCLAGAVLALWRAFGANVHPRALPWSVLVLDTLFSFWFLAGARLLRRAAFAASKNGAERAAGSAHAGGRRVLVAGAGYKGIDLIRRFAPSGGFVPVGFLDDDPAKFGFSAAGVSVLGTLADAGRVAWSNRADLVVAAFDRPEEAVARIRESCAAAGVSCAVATYADFAGPAPGRTAGVFLRLDPAAGRLRVSAPAGAPEAAAAAASAIERTLNAPDAAGIGKKIAALLEAAHVRE